MNFVRIPILKAHNAGVPPIGIAESDSTGAIIITLNDGHEMAADKFFSNFGNIGGQVLEGIDVDGERRIKRFRVREFSIG